MSKFFNFIISIFLTILFIATTGCNTKQLDSDRPIQAEEKRRKNIDEGRGVSLGGIVGKARGGTNYEFSTSNPMWRASLETLDFLPLTTVDYSGGIIITDWYSDGNKKESIKITLRFLSNEIRSDSIKIIVHNKKCKTTQNCSVNEIDSNIKMELRQSILRKASLLEKESKEKKKK